MRVAIASLAAALLSSVIVPSVASAQRPAIGHVFMIVLENESASTTFGPHSPAPFLSKTLRSAGAYLPKYYGVGHQSNDNYIAMISGQAPNIQTQADCQVFDDVTPGTITSFGQAQGSGCVYPAGVQTIAGQLSARSLSWRDYNESMGSDPSREPAVCAHPALNHLDGTQRASSTDQYATRHNPFVYFHSIIDSSALCNRHVVNLKLLPKDLASAATTPNYVFISPDLCEDGHDAPCANGRPGGLVQADRFLRKWVPMITSSPAFRAQNGLLIINFDEGASSDTASCCGERPGPGSPMPGATGPGGGDTGAVLLSPCIAPGTVSMSPYNHYTMLRSVEDLFGLSHLGFAALPGGRSLGSDVFTRSCATLPGVQVHAPGIASNAGTGPRVTVSWTALATGAGLFTVQVRELGRSKPAWRTLLRFTKRHALHFSGRLGATYQFRVRLAAGPWAYVRTVVPTGIRVPGGSYTGRWTVMRDRSAWNGQAIASSSSGAGFGLGYRGGSLAVIGERSPRGGVISVILDGHTSTVALHAARKITRQVIYLRHLAPGSHHLRIRVLRGLAALEGLAIDSRQQ